MQTSYRSFFSVDSGMGEETHPAIPTGKKVILYTIEYLSEDKLTLTPYHEVKNEKLHEFQM